MNTKIDNRVEIHFMIGLRRLIWSSEFFRFQITLSKRPNTLNKEIAFGSGGITQGFERQKKPRLCREVLNLT